MARFSAADQAFINALGYVATICATEVDQGSIKMACDIMRDLIPSVNRDDEQLSPLVLAAEDLLADHPMGRHFAAQALAQFYHWRMTMAYDLFAGQSEAS